MKWCHTCFKKLPKTAELKIGGRLLCADRYEELKPDSLTGTCPFLNLRKKCYRLMMGNWNTLT